MLFSKSAATTEQPGAANAKPKGLTLTTLTTFLRPRRRSNSTSSIVTIDGVDFELIESPAALAFAMTQHTTPSVEINVCTTVEVTYEPADDADCAFGTKTVVTSTCEGPRSS